MSEQSFPFKLGIHPINWVGEDVFEHGDHYTAEEVLHDISTLGFRGTEVSRKFPKEVRPLKELLNHYHMSLTTQWKSVHFSKPENLKQQLEAYRAHCDFLAEFGCNVVSTAEIGGSILNQDPTRGEDEVNVIRLDDEGWKYVSEGLNEAGHIAKVRGLDLVYHPHAGTVIENREEVDRLMEMTDASVVSLLFDTGHNVYGGINPLDLLQTYYNRVKYIHLKDVRLDILRQVKGNVGIRDSIRRGMFTVPGDGNLEFEPIFKELAERGYEGWMLIEGEQDPAIHHPYNYARKSKAFIEKTVQQVMAHS
ncbi:myo-inosose-2 dehydratase [Shouchella shacheensis]|uniref:myo-inosose-2 dehydratase n=1 Tax=Shouchella shacheensis TaxID=1649580 RepID=UPI0007403338|nr:myo-inosose-2 dehydratase [Shouchella shacheensis]